MEINFKEDKDVWDKFVETSPHRSIFVTTSFLDSLGTKYDLITCRNGQNILAGAVIIFDKDGNPMSSIHKFTQYQGLILADNSYMPRIHSRISHDFKVVEFFIDSLVNRYKKFNLCQHWRFNDLRPFQWYNYHEPEKGMFKLVLRYTTVISKDNYSNFDKFISGIRLSRRVEYRKAKDKLEIKSIKDETVLDNLHNDLFKRQGISRSMEESNLVKSITFNSLDRGSGSLKIATLDNIPVSSLLTINDNRTSFFQFAGTSTEYRDLGGYTYLSIDMIKDAFDVGCSEVEIVGANSPNRSDYKISFNAELKPYFEVYFGK